jgi:UrcA family protein
MTRSMFEVGLPLTLALAIVSGTVFAQEKDQTSEITIQGKQVPVTKTVEQPFSGEPIDRYTFTTPVNFDNLDLTTPAGVAQLKKRVAEAAREGCNELQQVAAPMDLLADDQTCVQESTAEGMVKARAAIAAAKSANASTRTAQVTSN